MPGVDASPVLAEMVEEAQQKQLEAITVETATGTLDALQTLQASLDLTNVLVMVLIASVLAMGLVRSLLGWLHGN